MNQKNLQWIIEQLATSGELFVAIPPSHYPSPNFRTRVFEGPGDLKIEILENPIPSRNQVSFFTMGIPGLEEKLRLAIKIFDYSLGEYKRDEFLKECKDAKEENRARDDIPYLSMEFPTQNAGVIVSSALSLPQIGASFYDTQKKLILLSPITDSSNPLYKRILESVARRLHAIHSRHLSQEQPIPGAGSSDFYFNFSGKDYMSILKTFFVNLLLSNPRKENQSELEQVALDFENAFRSQIVERHLLNRERYVLIHGDIHHNHLFLTKDGNCNLVDSGSCSLGNLEEDLASFVLSISANPLLNWSPEERKKFESDFLTAYSNVSGKEVDNKVYLAAKSFYGLFLYSNFMRNDLRQRKVNFSQPLYKNSNRYYAGFAENLISQAGEAIYDLAKLDSGPNHIRIELYEGKYDVFEKLCLLSRDSELSNVADAPWADILDEIPVPNVWGYGMMDHILNYMFSSEHAKRIPMPTAFQPVNSDIDKYPLLHSFSVSFDPPGILDIPYARRRAQFGAEH